MNLLLKIKRIKDLSPSERQVANFILENPDSIANMGIVEIAQKTYTSTSTIMRLCKKLGMDSFIDFRVQLASDIRNYKKSKSVFTKQSPIDKSDSLDAIIDKVSSNNARAVIDAKVLNDISTFQKAVDLMCKAGQLDFYGMGVSNLIAQDALIKALRLGIRATSYPFYSEMAMASKVSDKSHLAIFISYTGLTTDTINIAKNIKKNGVPSISITSMTQNPLIEYCDVNLFVDSYESVYRIGGMSSRISTQNIMDILFTAYINSNYEKFMDTISKTFITENLSGKSTKSK